MDLLFSIPSNGHDIRREYLLLYYDLGARSCDQTLFVCDLATREPKIYRALSGMDSGLEAFSRNPAHGSFSALFGRTTEFTKYVTQRFLSY